MPKLSFSDALGHFQANRLDDAESILSGLPAARCDANSWMLRGLIAQRQGRHVDALTHYDASIKKDASHAPTWLNRAHPLSHLRRYAEAEHSVARARSLQDSIQAQAMLLRVQLAADRCGDALANGAIFCARTPDNGLLHALTGQAARQEGDLRRAFTHLQTAFRLGRIESAAPLAQTLHDLGHRAQALKFINSCPESAPDIQHVKGIILGDERRWDEAIDAFNEAVTCDPSNVRLRLNFSHTLSRAAHHEASLEQLRQSLALEPDNPLPWISFADACQHVRSLTPDDIPLLNTAMDRNDIAHQHLEQLVRSFIEQDPRVSYWIHGISGITPSLIEALDTSLTRLWWTKTIVHCSKWERALTQLRRHISTGLTPAISAELTEALAVQAWHTQFAWPVSEAEQQALCRPLPPLTEALYRMMDSAMGLPEALATLHVTNKGIERALAESFQSLDREPNEHSARVRAQYESDPYPRLVPWAQKPVASIQKLVSDCLMSPPEHLPSGRPLRVLIAGCGTGQQVLGVARYAGAELYAFDLSRASLAVAARHASVAGVSCTFAQGDILSLDTRALERLGWPTSFDVIECGGVLHHLQDPIAGWRALVSLLSPNGLMKIGLYSRRARRGVLHARALVDGFSTDAEGLRSARSILLALPSDDPAFAVTRSIDFRSLSGFRDLAMHVHEVQFSPIELAKMMTELSLTFLGFQHRHPAIAQHYAQAHPNDPQQRDLTLWEQFEVQHPSTFEGMFQFWCQRDSGR